MQPNKPVKQLNSRQIDQINELSAKENQEIQEALNNAPVPAELLDIRFPGWLKNALIHETYITMNAGYTEYRAFFKSLSEKPTHELNLREFGIALNCVESKSMFQLCLATHDEYINVQDHVAVLCAKWTAHAEKIKQPIMDRYQKLAGMVANNKPIIMPSSSKILT